MRIRKLFLDTFPKHLLYGTVTAVIASFLCIGVGCIDFYSQWDQEKQAFAEWKRIEQRCKAIAKQPVSPEEIQSKLSNKTSPEKDIFIELDIQEMKRYGKSQKEIDDILDSQERARTTETIINSRLNAENCPEMAFGKFLEAQSPGSLISYVVARRDTKEIVSAVFIISFLATILILDSGKRLLRIGHNGWIRLSFVFSAVCGALYFLAYREELSNEALLLYSPTAFAAGWVAYAYTVSAYRWVAEGFEQQSSTSRHPNPEDSARYAPSVASTPTIPVSGNVLSTNPAAVDYSEAFWRRLWARCIDLAICWVFGSVAAEILLSFAPSMNSLSAMWVNLIIAQAVFCAVAFYYEWVFLSKFGATLGKMAVGLKVFSIDNRLPTAAEAKTRAWAYLISGCYFLLWSPMLQIVSAFQAKKRIPAMQPWELASRTYVSKPPIGRVRVWVVGFIAIFLMIFIVTVQQMVKNVRKEQVTEHILGV